MLGQEAPLGDSQQGLHQQVYIQLAARTPDHFDSAFLTHIAPPFSSALPVHKSGQVLLVVMSPQSGTVKPWNSQQAGLTAAEERHQDEADDGQGDKRRQEGREQSIDHPRPNRHRDEQEDRAQDRARHRRPAVRGHLVLLGAQVVADDSAHASDGLVGGHAHAVLGLHLLGHDAELPAVAEHDEALVGQSDDEPESERAEQGEDDHHGD